jgi:methionyl-tRNA formyltransferase
MGTPEFAVLPLQRLIEAGANIVAVVTNPDKPAGRGRKILESDVKKFAVEKGLKILQPNKFRDENFIKELHDLKADLQIVVAFKMLPEIVWDMPKLGTINLHASLLPQYRGAAPINWAVINGDKKTGVSTFLLQHEIDTGNVIRQEEISIEDEDNVGVVYDKLMHLGAEVLVKTVADLASNNCKFVSQEKLSEGLELRPAPKIFREDCLIDWTNDLESIHNLVRGMSPYPAAFTQLEINGKTLDFKIYKSECEFTDNVKEKTVLTDYKNYLKISTRNGFLNILECQLSGKKRMKIQDLLRGIQENIPVNLID